MEHISSENQSVRCTRTLVNALFGQHRQLFFLAFRSQQPKKSKNKQNTLTKLKSRFPVFKFLTNALKLVIPKLQKISA